MDLVLREVAWNDPDGAALRSAQETELNAIWGEPDSHPPTDADVAVFLVGYLDRTPVACGGLRPLGEHSVEIKRMYVVPDARGRGLSRVLLTALEAAALARGWPTVRLETGDRLPAALRLYESAGYQPIPRYGAYACHESSLCFEKHLPDLPR